MKVSKRKFSSLVESLRDFLRTFDKANKSLQIPLPKHKIEIRSTKSKGNLFDPYYIVITENPKKKIRLSFRYGNKNSCVFPLRRNKIYGFQF